MHTEGSVVSNGSGSSSAFNDSILLKFLSGDWSKSYYYQHWRHGILLSNKHCSNVNVLLHRIMGLALGFSIYQQHSLEVLKLSGD